MPVLGQLSLGVGSGSAHSTGGLVGGAGHSLSGGWGGGGAVIFFSPPPHSLWWKYDVLLLFAADGDHYRNPNWSERERELIMLPKCKDTPRTHPCT